MPGLARSSRAPIPGPMSSTARSILPSSRFSVSTCSRYRNLSGIGTLFRLDKLFSALVKTYVCTGGRVMEAESSIKTSLEQQALEVDLEHQSTLLMAAAQKDVEQQLTQPMAVEQHPADQQATLPMAFKPGRRFSRAPHILIPLSLGAILIAGLLLGAVLTGH